MYAYNHPWPGPVLTLDHARHIQFPTSAIKDPSLLQHSELSTFCSWKGYASYWDVIVDGKQIRTSAATKGCLKLNCSIGKTLENAAWYYKEPYEKAANIKNHIAFCE
jgi:uncharacterized protein (DUF427 family)